MKYIKKTKRISVPSIIEKKWTKWLKIYHEVNASLENRGKLEQYRNNLKKKLEDASIFTKDERLHENAKHVIGDLFDEVILRRMPSLKDEIVFHKDRVIIEKISEQYVRCFYSEGSVFIRYEGKHTPVFNCSEYVTYANVEYLGARLFLMKNNEIIS